MPSLLTEAEVARLTAASLPNDAWLILGNSLPVRTVDSYCRASSADFHVLSQRGASGIDGLISGAAGVASIARDPVVLLIGDISFLHDVGGLLLASAAHVPLIIVVVNNGGGRIFEQLPVGRAVPEAIMRHFTTPQDCVIEHAAKLYRHEFARAETPSDFHSALAAAYRCTGCTVIEAVVPPHGAQEDRTRVLAALRRFYAA